MALPEISFIVVTRNEPAPLLTSTLDGLFETSKAFRTEVIVIDDASRCPADCKPYKVRLVRINRSIGVSRARGLGASIAKGKILVWLDAHMTFDPHWLLEMLRYVNSGSLLCSASWDYDQSICHCWGADFVWMADRNYPEQLFPGFKCLHRTEFPGVGAVEVPMVIGACYMMLKSSYKKIGGCCPFFRVWGMDDEDLSARAWLTGIGVRCVTSARVGHFYRDQFPYKVSWNHVEFNQTIMIRSIFGSNTVRALEQLLKPLPPQVRRWLGAVDLKAWRGRIQARRQMSDADFFAKLVTDSTLELTRKGQLKKF